MKRKILSVITSITGARVVIGEQEITHALEDHFMFLPQDMVLELLEKILKDPTVIYEEKASHLYHMFYRLDNGYYIVAVVKKTDSGCYFTTMYPTGKTVRNKHKGLKKVKI